MIAALFALLLAQPCPPGKVCSRPAPEIASPAKTEAAPLKKLLHKERSAVTKRAKSHLPPAPSKLRPFAHKSCHRSRSHGRPLFHGMGPRAWQSARYR
jgi:hypothetical protein